MEIAVQQDDTVDFLNKVKAVSNMCRISRLEKMLSDFLDNMPQDSCVNYIGELNKNDVMH